MAAWCRNRCEAALDPVSQYGIPVWMIDWVLLIQDFRFGSLSGASYASPAFDTTNWSSEQSQRYRVIQTAHFCFSLAGGK
jgi:hypothetical protein